MMGYTTKKCNEIYGTNLGKEFTQIFAPMIAKSYLNTQKKSASLIVMYATNSCPTGIQPSPYQKLGAILHNGKDFKEKWRTAVIRVD